MAVEEQKQISLIEKWQNEMNLIQEKTGIKGIYVVLGLILCVILVYLNIFDSVITNLVGTLYPAFWTIKSIEKNDLSEQKNWLTYWAVFGFFVLIDMFSPIFVKFIPFYLVLKILFLIWMFMPGTNGNKFIYNKVVKKILKKYEKEADEFLKNVGGVLRNEDDYKRFPRKITNNLNNLDEINKTVLDLRKKESEEEEEKEKENDIQEKENNKQEKEKIE